MISSTQASCAKRAPLKWASPHGRKLPSPEKRTLVMGVLNITPNSFSGDGRLGQEQHILNQVNTMVRSGMDVLDIGGVPTRPPYSEKIEQDKTGEDPFPVYHSDAYAVSEEGELQRILPVIESIRQKYPQLPISTDTTRASVAKACIEAGADIINDQKALLEGVCDKEVKAFKAGDKASIASPMATAIQELNCPIILMHNRVETAYQDFWKEVLEDLTLSLTIAQNAGIFKKPALGGSRLLLWQRSAPQSRDGKKH